MDELNNEYPFLEFASEFGISAKLLKIRSKMQPQAFMLILSMEVKKYIELNIYKGRTPKLLGLFRPVQFWGFFDFNIEMGM